MISIEFKDGESISLSVGSTMSTKKTVLEINKIIVSGACLLEVTTLIEGINRYKSIMNEPTIKEREFTWTGTQAHIIYEWLKLMSMAPKDKDNDYYEI